MRALLIVDVQNDFCPGGALPVLDGDAVVPEINRLMPAYDLVVATQDWHPPEHVSFAPTHGREPYTSISWDGHTLDLWPIHCVAGTWGADFHPDLDTRGIQLIVRKGTRPDQEAYSGFAEPGLRAYLQALHIERLDVAGLAFDFCVRASAVDAAGAGMGVRVLSRATRAVFPDRNEELARLLAAQHVAVV